MSAKGTRVNEWFVPSFGPAKFRAFVGLLFLPYTGMCIAFTVIGSMIAPDVQWDRVGAIAFIYALALGVGAHSADSLGSKKAKPWGYYFSKSQMVTLMVSTIAMAYVVGAYYIVLFVPLLAIVAVLEGFFLFAYNFEMWNGRFHNNLWFSVSWGALPVAAGYIMQTGSFGFLPAAVAAAASLVSYTEIKLSRPYKQSKKINGGEGMTNRLEGQLKIVSLTTISFSVLLVVARLLMP